MQSTFLSQRRGERFDVFVHQVVLGLFPPAQHRQARFVDDEIFVIRLTLNLPARNGKHGANANALSDQCRKLLLQADVLSSGANERDAFSRRQECESALFDDNSAACSGPFCENMNRIYAGLTDDHMIDDPGRGTDIVEYMTDASGMLLQLVTHSDIGVTVQTKPQ